MLRLQNEIIHSNTVFKFQSHSSDDFMVHQGAIMQHPSTC